MTQAAVLASNASLMTTPSGTAPGYLARAWVNFNGTGTVAIRASGNVSSITDNGTGLYRINFTTSMPDANYSFSSGYGDGASAGTVLIRASVGNFLTSSLAIETVSTTAFQDVGVVNVSIFR